jgi:Phytanoyl-CoA dioxygenase (PhyH)
MGVFSTSQLTEYQEKGFVLLEQAFPRALALRCRDLLWEQIEEDPSDPSTWERPVVRVGSQGHLAFSQAAQSSRWVEAIHEVAGPLAAPAPWIGGTFAIRFPVEGDPGDDGWHIEGSYLGPDGGWWSNHWSKDRALLMLVLFSDVGDDDAPTRIRVGSQLHVPKALLPHGDEGTNPQHLKLPREIHDLPLALATGVAGDVYLCHPFLVHAAQRNLRGQPRFIAQPGVPWKVGGRLGTPSSSKDHSP